MPTSSGTRSVCAGFVLVSCSFGAVVYVQRRRLVLIDSARFVSFEWARHVRFAHMSAAATCPVAAGLLNEA